MSCWLISEPCWCFTYPLTLCRSAANNTWHLWHVGMRLMWLHIELSMSTDRKCCQKHLAPVTRWYALALVVHEWHWVNENHCSCKYGERRHVWGWSVRIWDCPIVVSVVWCRKWGAANHMQGKRSLLFLELWLYKFGCCWVLWQQRFFGGLGTTVLWPVNFCRSGFSPRPAKVLFVPLMFFWKLDP